MHRQLSLNYYRTDNGYLIEHAGSGTTSQYVFNECEDAEKKLIEILGETINEKLIKRDAAEGILLSLVWPEGETVKELESKIIRKLSELKEL